MQLKMQSNEMATCLFNVFMCGKLSHLYLLRISSAAGVYIYDFKEKSFGKYSEGKGKEKLNFIFNTLSTYLLLISFDLFFTHKDYDLDKEMELNIFFSFLSSFFFWPEKDDENGKESFQKDI